MCASVFAKFTEMTSARFAPVMFGFWRVHLGDASACSGSLARNVGNSTLFTPICVRCLPALRVLDKRVAMPCGRPCFRCRNVAPKSGPRFCYGLSVSDLLSQLSGRILAPDAGRTLRSDLGPPFAKSLASVAVNLNPCASFGLRAVLAAFVGVPDAAADQAS